MTAVNFPDPSASPWYNDPATGGNGVTYEYANGVWSAVSSPSDALDDRYVEVAGDHMTGDLTIGPDATTNNHLISKDGFLRSRKLEVYPVGDTADTTPGAEFSRAASEGYITAVSESGSGAFAIKANGSSAARLFFKSLGNIDETVTIWRQNSNLRLSTSTSLGSVLVDTKDVQIGGDLTSDNPNIRLAANGDVQMVSQNSGPLAGFRNQVINGAMAIWQRGTVVSNTSGYGADRWRMAATSTTTEYRRNINGNCPECPIAMQVTSSATTTDYLIQAIELPIAGKPGPFIQGSRWTLSFWANQDMITGWHQSNALQFKDDATSASAVNAVVGGNAPPVVIETSATDSSWKRYAIQDLVIGADPANTNQCLAVRIAISDSVVRIGQVQLEPGPVATPFEHRPYGTELALCQRYFRKYSATNNGYSGIFTHSPVNSPGTGASETAWNCYIGISGEMRIPNPSTSFGGGNTTRFNLNARNGGSSVIVDSIACAAFSKGIFYITTSTATDPSAKPQLRGNGSSSTGWFGLDAEL